MPKIRGVIVIAEGAADISVRFSLAAAVSTVLGIDENSVEVFAMLPKRIDTNPAGEEMAQNAAKA